MTSLLLSVDKGKQRIFEFDLVDGVDKVITVSGINLDKAILQTTDDNQTVDVAVVRDALNNEVTVTATGGNLTDVTSISSRTILVQ